MVFVCFFCHGCFNALLLCTGICSVFTSVLKAFWHDYSAECFILISYIINMYTHLCINILTWLFSWLFHSYIICFRCISLHLFSHYICSSFESNLRLAMFSRVHNIWILWCVSCCSTGMLYDVSFYSHFLG